MQPQEAKAVIEALLFVCETPLALSRLEKVLSPYPRLEIEERLAELQQEYAPLKRGLQLVKVAGGYQLTTRPDLATWVRKLFKDKESRSLSSPALETLAIIAYKQPIMRAEIEAIRGVEVSGLLYSLLDKSLIRIAGRAKGPGRPLLYGTSDEFLLYFGLEDLGGLPKRKELVLEKEGVGE